MFAEVPQAAGYRGWYGRFLPGFESFRERTQQITAAEVSRGALISKFERALQISAACHGYYMTASAKVRRLMNQGFFSKIFLAEDGTVEDAELHDIFAGLFARDSFTMIQNRKARAKQMLAGRGIELTATGTDGRGVGSRALLAVASHDEEQDVQGRSRYSPTSVLLSLAGDQRPRPELSFGPGSTSTFGGRYGI